MTRPNLIDLFCGCGGISLGAARAGFQVLAGIDKDNRSLLAHTKNFPTTNQFNLDLSCTTGQQILNEINLKRNEIDVVVGGPPCQGFSTIGKRDLSDPRNLLISDFFRLVAEMWPRAFVLENVPGVLNEVHGPRLLAAIASVSKHYEVSNPQKIIGVNAGAPTLRTRVFIVGLRKPSHIPEDFWSGMIDRNNVPVVRHAMDGLPVDVGSDWKACKDGKRTVRVLRSGAFFDSVKGRIPSGVGDPASLELYHSRMVVTGCTGTLHSSALTERYASLGYGEADRKTKSVKLDPNGYCPTLRAGTGPDRGSFQAVRPIHYLRPRVITPREAVRLQGFPDWFQFDPTKWHAFRQIGNSVSPLVAEFVLRRVRKVLERG